jgi:hypothetical protein
MTKYRRIGTRFSKEKQLLKPVAKFAQEQGFCLQEHELPFYEYRIDLYGFSAHHNSTVAFELKLADWRRALEQALLYQLCSDYVYIAMPERSAGKVDISQLRTQGIGLISVRESGDCSCLLPAAEHSEVRQFYRSTQIEFLKEFASA